MAASNFKTDDDIEYRAGSDVKIAFVERLCALAYPIPSPKAYRLKLVATQLELNESTKL